MNLPPRLPLLVTAGQSAASLGSMRESQCGDFSTAYNLRGNEVLHESMSSLGTAGMSRVRSSSTSRLVPGPCQGQTTVKGSSSQRHKKASAGAVLAARWTTWNSGDALVQAPPHLR
ncbi:unnamed protein product [Chrysoparadoxa australica]